MYQDILKKIGLQENEIKVYSTLLKEGNLTAAEVSNLSELKRGITYYILDKLIEYNLIEKIKEGKKTYFCLKHPRAIKEFIRQKRRELDEASSNTDHLLPEIIDEYHIGQHKPGVYYFEGMDGLIRAYAELLEEKENIDSFEQTGAKSEFITKKFKKEQEDYIKKRVSLKIFNRIIAPSNYTFKTNPKELREVRYFPESKFPFEMDIKICGNKTLLVTFKQGNFNATLIDNPEIAKNYKILFKFLWENVATPHP